MVSEPQLREGTFYTHLVFYMHDFGRSFRPGYVRFCGACLQNDFPKELFLFVCCLFGCDVMGSMCLVGVWN